MKITDIKQQVKRADRYSIYVDGKYSFSLGEVELLDSKLVNGQEVTETEVANLKEKSDFGKVYEKILNLLSFRARSEWELRDYLKRKKQPPETIEKILNKLSLSGYLDDEKFARRWLDNRRLLRATSKRRLRQELMQKRISSEIIDQVLTDDETDELDVLRELVARKSSRYPDKLKLMQYLARQGYNYNDIKSVLDDPSLG